MTSSYYGVQPWNNPSRQSSWDQPPPSRSGASSAVSREESVAFGPQFEEVDRAIDNLMKSGKLVGRRESGPFPVAGGRPYVDFDPRIGGPARHHSMDYDPMRSHSASGLQNFYGNARYPSRGMEADPMSQAKRRMAAQRERDLRNYHQEQQYNRSMTQPHPTQAKSERSMSPNAMSEDERRDLIARQHKALYGSEGSFYDAQGSGDDSQTPRPGNPPIANLAAGGRGQSPMTYGSFAVQDPSQVSGVEEGGKSGPSPNPQATRSRTNSNSSPASNTQNFGVFDQAAAAQQSSRTSTSSPGGSPPRSAKTATAPAPIGTRPINPALAKRATPPASSPLSFGFAPNEGAHPGERAGSVAGNGGVAGKENMSSTSVNWGASSGVWGKSSLGGVSSAVWG